MNDQQLVRVAAVQMEPRLAAIGRNLDLILSKLDEAAGQGARLIAFPECALSGYCFESADEARAASEPADGPSGRAIARECARLGAWSIHGFIESDGQNLYNACSLIGPEGLAAVYRKIHLPALGLDKLVAPGAGPFEVQDAGGVKVGMHICYDGTFPEAGRVLTLLGAELLVLPTNWPRHSETAAEHMIATRALENVVYAMAVNRVGEERGFRFIGRSSIAAPTGEILAFASPDREEVLYADVDPARARQKRLVRVPGKHEVDRIADRRPGLYGAIVAPNGRK